MEMEEYIFYKCVHCKTNFTNYDSISDHFEQFHSEGIDVEDEEWDEELEAYLESHTYKRCGFCKQKFSFRHADLWNHLIVNHNRYYGMLVIYKCKICGETKSRDKKHLEDHFTLIHGINKHKSKITIRRCGLCNKDFSSSKELEDHFTNNYGLKKSDIENYRKIVMHRYQSVIAFKEKFRKAKKENNLKDLTTYNEEESNDTVKEAMKKVTTDAIFSSSNDETIENSAAIKAKLEESKNNLEYDTEIEEKNPSQEADNIIAKDISIECHLCKEKFTNENSIVEHRKLFHQNIITLNNYNHASANIDIEEVNITKDIMKIMPLNAILSTSKEEMIQDPTIVKFTLQTINSEDQKIKTDHELKEDKEETQIVSNNETIESSAEIKAKKCHSRDTKLTIIPSLDKHMKSTHRAENIIAKDTATNKNSPCEECNISTPNKGSLKTHEEYPKVTETISPPNVNLLTNHVEDINFKIPEIQKYSTKSQEAEKDVDSTREVDSDISQTKVFIGKNIFQKTATIKPEIFKHETEEETESTRAGINKEQEKFSNCDDPLPSVETFQKVDLLMNNAKIKTEIFEHEAEDNIDSAEAVAKTENHETKDETEISKHETEEETESTRAGINTNEIETIKEKLTNKALQLNRAELSDLKKEVTNQRSEISDLKFETKNHSQSLEESINKVLQFEKKIASSGSKLSDLESKITEITNSLKSMKVALANKLDKSDQDKNSSKKRVNVNETNITTGENISKQSEQTPGSLCTKTSQANKLNKSEKNLSEKRVNVSKTKISTGENISQNITKQSGQTSGTLCTETSQANKLNKSDKNLSEKRVNISKTKIITGENIFQNTTKQSEQTSGSLYTESKEVTINTQELDILHENNLAENSANPSTILELPKVQEKCISAITVNTISILKLKEKQEKLENENATNFELINFIKQNCKCRLNGNSPGETSSGEQIHANNTLSEITTEENISIEQSNHGTKTNTKIEAETTSPEKISPEKQFNTISSLSEPVTNFAKESVEQSKQEAIAEKESEPSKYEEEADIKTKVDIAPSETISSAEPFKTSNIRKNIPQNVAIKIVERSEYEAIKESEHFKYEEEADIKTKVDIDPPETTSSKETFKTSNIRKNIPRNVAEKIVERSKYEAITEKESENSKYEEETDIKIEESKKSVYKTATKVSYPVNQTIVEKESEEPVYETETKVSDPKNHIAAETFGKTKVSNPDDHVVAEIKALYYETKTESKMDDNNSLFRIWSGILTILSTFMAASPLHGYKPKGVFGNFPNNKNIAIDISTQKHKVYNNNKQQLRKFDLPRPQNISGALREIKHSSRESDTVNNLSSFMLKMTQKGKYNRRQYFFKSWKNYFIEGIRQAIVGRISI